MCCCCKPGVMNSCQNVQQSMEGFQHRLLLDMRTISWLFIVLVGLVKICLFVGCLTSQQHASVSQGRICTDNYTCCHTEIEAADQTFHLTQSQYTDTGPTSPSADPKTPGAWSANFEVTGMTRPRKKSRRKRDSNPGPSALEADALPLGQRGGVWLRICV